MRKINRHNSTYFAFVFAFTLLCFVGKDIVIQLSDTLYSVDDYNVDEQSSSDESDQKEDVKIPALIFSYTCLDGILDRRYVFFGKKKALKCRYIDIQVPPPRLV